MNIPKSWILTNLEVISQVILGQSPPSKTYNQNQDGLPFYQGKSEFGYVFPSPVKWCSKPKKIALENDILISVRAPVGPTNICQEKSCIGRGLAAIRPKEKISNKFIFYFLRKIENYWARKSTGTTFSAITGNVLKKQNIPIAPSNEQTRIVAKIEELFSHLEAGQAALGRARANLRRYRQSLLKAAFSGELTRAWREQHKEELEPASELLKQINAERRARWEADQRAKGKDPTKAKYIEPEPPDTVGLPELPEGWEYITIDSISKIFGGKRLPKGAIYTENTTEHPYIRVIDFENYSINSTNLCFIDEVIFQKIKRYTINSCDIYISIADTIGKTGTVPKALDGANLTENAAKITSLDFYDNKLLSYFLSSTFAQTQINKFTIFTNQPKLALFRIKKITIPFFSQPEQNELVSLIENQCGYINNFEKLIHNQEIRTRRLKDSILDKAFSGQLVQQDPNDEHAEELLKRFKAANPGNTLNKSTN